MTHLTPISNRINNAKMPRTYRVRLELGRLTDTGFADGKTVERSFCKHVKEKDLAKALSAISGSHRKEALRHMGVNPRSQQAYEVSEHVTS